MAKIKKIKKYLEKLKYLITREVAAVELQILGIMENLFSGMWMNTVLQIVDKITKTINAIQIVKSSIENLKQFNDSENIFHG